MASPDPFVRRVVGVVVEGGDVHVVLEVSVYHLPSSEVREAGAATQNWQETARTRYWKAALLRDGCCLGSGG